MGFPIARTMVFWGLYWGPLFRETSIAFRETSISCWERAVLSNTMGQYNVDPQRPLFHFDNRPSDLGLNIQGSRSVLVEASGCGYSLTILNDVHIFVH